MEDFMGGPKSSSVLSPVNMYHYQNLADSQIKHPVSSSIFPCNHFPSNIVQDIDIDIDIEDLFTVEYNNITT